jgi:hypothetical protein
MCVSEDCEYSNYPGTQRKDRKGDEFCALPPQGFSALFLGIAGTAKGGLSPVLDLTHKL